MKYSREPLTVTLSEPDPCEVEWSLTRKRATAVPRTKPARTSEQWLRYSDTRLRPVRKAEHSVTRHSTGLASRLDLVLMVLVMYIWRRGAR